MKYLRIGYISLSNNPSNYKNIPFTIKNAPQVLYMENYRGKKPQIGSIQIIYQCKYQVLSVCENQIIYIKPKLKETENIIVKPASVIRTIEVLNDPIKNKWINICGIQFAGKLNKQTKKDYLETKNSILNFKNNYEEHKIKHVIFGNLNVNLETKNSEDKNLYNFMQKYQANNYRQLSYDTDMATNGNRDTAIDENSNKYFVDYAYIYKDYYGQIKVKCSNKYITNHRYLELQVNIWEEKDHKQVEDEQLYIKQPLEFKRLYSKLKNTVKNISLSNLDTDPHINIKLNIKNKPLSYEIRYKNNQWELKSKTNKSNVYTFNEFDLLTFLKKSISS